MEIAPTLPASFRVQQLAPWICLSVLVVISPILDALGQQSIPLISPSTGQLLGSAAVGGVITGALAGLVGSSLRAEWERFFKIACLAVALVVFVELSGFYSAMYLTLASAGLGVRGARMLTIAGIGGAAVLLAWLIIRGGRQTTAALGIFLAVMFVSTIGKHWSAWSTKLPAVAIATTNSKPAVIHIVLDEMIGPAGIPKQISGGAELERLMLEMFRRHGFSVYPRAFSRHFMTAVSIPNLLNYDYEDATFGTVSRYQSTDNFRVNRQNAYFETLREQGFALSVYQTVFFDFCKAGPVASCVTFPSYNPWNSYVRGGQAADAQRRTAQILQRASDKSRLLSAYFGVFVGDTGKLNNPMNPIRFDLHGLPAWIQSIGDGIVGNARGVAHFAHVLAPHGPYILDRNCQVVHPWTTLPQFMREDRGLSAAEFIVERKLQYERYFEQSHCLLMLVDGLLQRIVAEPKLSDAVIVVHGDHGSRLSAGRFIETVEPLDLIDNYSTLFAIRQPGVAAMKDDRRASIHRLFAERFKPGSVARTTDPESVAIERRDSKRVEPTPMPPF
jgi:hypothetical protein